MQKITNFTEKFGKNAQDTGSSEVQIALLSARIGEISQHLAQHKKDHSSRFGLIKMVNKRKKLLKYLAQRHVERYQRIIKSLGIRK